MKMIKLPVTSCNACKYSDWHPIKDYYFCTLTNNKINRMAKINNDCPLDDYKD